MRVRKATDKVSRDYWKFVERTAREVARWPDWKKGLTNVRECATISNNPSKSKRKR